MPIAPKIKPAISTLQELYDYLAVTASDAAQTLPSGVTLATFLQRLLDTTAWDITRILGRDYTNGQIMTVSFFGDGSSYLRLPQPADPSAALSFVTAWSVASGAAVTPTVVVGDFQFVNGALGDGLDVYYTKGPFQRDVAYEIQYLRGTISFDSVTAWPMPIAQIQREWCSLIYRESVNGQDTLGFLDIHLTPTIPTRIPDKLLEPYKLILSRLRPYIRFEA